MILVIVLAVLAGLGALLFMGGEEDAGTVRIGADPEATSTTEPETGPVDLTDDGSGEGRDARSELATAPTEDTGDAQASERETRGGATVSGRVADGSGRPVVGAQVRLERDAGGGLGGMAFMLGEPESGGRGRTVMTDPRGLFEFEGVTSGDQMLVVTAAGFATTEPERFEVEGPDPVDVGTLELELAIILSGRVVDSLGRGIADVALRSLPRVDMGGGMVIMSSIGPKGEPLTTSGPGGEFTIDTLASGPWRIETEHPEHPARTFEGKVDRPGDVERDLIWELPDGAVIQGYVVGTDRREGPYQVKYALGGSLDFAMFGSGGGSADVGENGAFDVRGLEPDTDYDLQVVRNAESSEGGMLTFIGIGGDQPALSEPKSVPSGTRDARLEILAPGRVQLRVVTGDNATPVEALTASIGEPWSLAPLREESGDTRRHHAGGIVEFDDVSSISDAMAFGGGTIVRIEAEGFVPLDVTLGERPDPGGVIDLGTVALEAARRARITVVGPDGPVQGARVALARASDRGFDMFGGGDSESFSISRSVTIDDESGESGEIEDVSGPDSRARARTDAQGLAEFDMPANDGKLRLTVEHRDYAPYAATLTVPPGTELVHTVEVGPGGTVLVRVVDPLGAPIEGIAVQHRGPGVGEDGMFGAPRTGADGTARFDRLAPGEHGFRTRAGSRGDTAVMPWEILGTDGSGKPWNELGVEHGDDLELVLNEAASATLVGQVRQDGEPLVGAGVSARAIDENSDPNEIEMAMFALGGRSAGRTDTDGRYTIEGLEPGTYELSVQHKDRALPATRELVIVAGVENIFDVDLLQNGIRGRVVDQSGDPIPGLVVRAKRAAGDAAGAVSRVAISILGGSGSGGGMSAMIGGPAGEPVRTDANGAFELPGLPEDTDLHVVVEPADGAPYSIGVESDVLRVGPGEWIEDVELEAPIGGAVEVTVEDSIVKELAFVLVEADRLDSGGTPIEDSRTTGFVDNGTCELLGLAPGTWRIGLRGVMNGGTGAPSYSADVEVLAGAREVLEF